MIFLFAGHSNSDPGAIGVNDRKEADETKKLRNAISSHIKAKHHTDNDAHSLSQVLATAKTGTGSVVCDLHFNAFNGKATGVEVLVQSDADDNDRGCANDILDLITSKTGIVSRGIKSESQSKRGRLGVMRESGIVVLVEVCFIDNPNDMAAYDAAFDDIAKDMAAILEKWDAVV